MLNRIWFWLLLIGILYGLGKGLVRTAWPDRRTERTASSDVDSAADSSAPDQAADRQSSEPAILATGKALNNAAFDAATSSVTICINLIGIMALWLGLLRVAQDAGLVDRLARILRPLVRWLFPGVPDGHPAQGAILMNLSANMLGLDNAATPFGLKAMQELQQLNPTPDTATDDMAMFLAINTSSITLIPFTIIGYRVAAGSADPTRPLVAMVLATTVSTMVAILAARWLSRRARYAADRKSTSTAGEESTHQIMMNPSRGRPADGSREDHGPGLP